MELSGGLWTCALDMWVSGGGRGRGGRRQLEQKEVTRNKVGKVAEAGL